jgi:hypothetical protein
MKRCGGAVVAAIAGNADKTSPATAIAASKLGFMIVPEAKPV